MAFDLDDRVLAGAAVPGENVRGHGAPSNLRSDAPSAVSAA